MILVGPHRVMMAMTRIRLKEMCSNSFEQAAPHNGRMRSLTALLSDQGRQIQVFIEARLFCKKKRLISGMVVQRFCRSYMESPPPAEIQK